MADKTCLLITQKDFYSFDKLIKQALEEKGFTVSVANHEYPTGFAGKIMGKLQLPVVFPITRNYITKHFLNNRSYQIILIIKGRGISNRLIERMKESTDRIIGYNWDSFKYNKGPLKWYRNVSKYCTFDFKDASDHSIPIVELFSSLTSSSEPKSIKYNIAAIFRNHSERLRYLDQILSNIKATTLFLYIYELNVFTFISNFLKYPFLYLKYRKYIRFKPLPYSVYRNVLENSEFTIDYAHSDQSGITMRCYEAISVGTKIITNNELIKESQYFNNSNSLIFRLNDDPDSLIYSYAQCKSRPFNADCRNISNFIDDLLESV